MSRIIESSEYNIDNTGKTLETGKLQSLIDRASKEQATLHLSGGIYLTAALFLKSNMQLVMDEDTVLLGTTDESQYDLVDTRIAGIEMQWYPGVLNIYNQENVTVTGGSIDGQGPYWWAKYWGVDMKGGMRKDYDSKGIRWACDYDCLRVRNMSVQNSSNVIIRNLTSRNSGFWNIHICYSHDVLVDGARITGNGMESPSTDGIDIDSCHDVTVRNCITNCNDDSICIKSGRDADGMRVGRECHDILVEDCEIRAGFGVTIGSEVSGGVRNIHIRNMNYSGTDCGFRIKSSRVRHGYIQNVLVENLTMMNVKYPIHMNLDWNPEYSVCTLPEGYEGEINNRWKSLLIPDDTSVPKTQLKDIVIQNVKTEMTDDYEGISRAFDIVGYEDEPINGICLENASMHCKEYGRIACVKNLSMNQVNIDAVMSYDEKNDEYDNR